MKTVVLLLSVFLFGRSSGQCNLTWEEVLEDSGTITNYNEMLVSNKYVVGPDGRQIHKYSLNHYIKKGPYSFAASARYFLKRQIKCYLLGKYPVDKDSISVYSFFYCNGNCAIDETSNNIYYAREFGIIYKSIRNVWNFSQNKPNWIVNNSCLSEPENERMKKLVAQMKEREK